MFRRPCFVLATSFILFACGGGASEPREPAPAATTPSSSATASAAVPSTTKPRTARPFTRCVSGDGSDAGAIPSDADAVIATLRPDFKSCYAAGLNVDELLQGCVIISAQISPTGEVVSDETARREGLSPEVAACLRAVVKKAHFNAPGGKGSTLNIPVTFINERSVP